MAAEQATLAAPISGSINLAPVLSLPAEMSPAGLQTPIGRSQKKSK
jgi:hypothetical protein